MQRFWGKGRIRFKVKSGKRRKQEPHRRTQMRGPQQAHGFRRWHPQNQGQRLQTWPALTLSPLVFNPYFPPSRSQAIFKRVLFLIVEILLPVYRAQPVAVALRPEPGRKKLPSAARDWEGSALPKVQKSSVFTPSLATSQPPRGPGPEPHPGQTPSLLLQRRPVSLLLPQANLSLTPRPGSYFLPRRE